MADSAEDRDPKVQDQDYGTAGIAAGVTAYKGALTLLNPSGYLEPAATDRTTLVCVGINADPTSDMNYDNSAGIAGAQNVRYFRKKSGYFSLDSTHPPTIADVGKPGYASDDQTVSREPGDGPYVGPIKSVDSGGVYVDVDPISHPPAASIGAEVWDDTQTLLAATALVFNPSRKYYPVVGSGGAVTLTADFPAGSYAGQEIVIVGTHDTNMVTITTGINTKTIDGLAVELADDCYVPFVYDGADWAQSGPMVHIA